MSAAGWSPSMQVVLVWQWVQSSAGDVYIETVQYLSGELHAFRLCAASGASSASASVHGPRSAFHEQPPANIKVRISDCRHTHTDTDTHRHTDTDRHRHRHTHTRLVERTVHQQTDRWTGRHRQTHIHRQTSTSRQWFGDQQQVWTWLASAWITNAMSTLWFELQLHVYLNAKSSRDSNYCMQFWVETVKVKW